MKKKIKKGFTLIELLAVIVILAIIALISTPIIIGLIDDARKEGFESSSYGIVDSAENGFAKTLLDREDVIQTEYKYEDGTVTRTEGNIEVNYNGRKPDSGTLIIDTQGKVAIALYQDGYCATKDYSESEIAIEKKDAEECTVPGAPVANADTSGANVPELITGMIPVKWNGTDWVKADINNGAGSNKWYDYDDKMWANAVTVTNANRTTYQSATAGTVIPMSDINTMWVWIPRYAYQIATSYHTSTAATINIKFLTGNTNVAQDSSTTSTSPTYSGSSQTNYVVHPAFRDYNDPDNVYLTGKWIAKFEPSVSDHNSQCYQTDFSEYCQYSYLIVNIVPNVKSWRNISWGTASNIALNMPNQTVYGFSGTSGYQIHMMSNRDWGAVTYLTQSIYGKNDKVWINNSQTFTTGCAGGSSNASAYNGCQNAYTTGNGQQASTTGNIYGIYDMVGGAWEYTLAYIDNSSDAISAQGGTHGGEQYSANYDDNAASNYDFISVIGGHIGDAVYETSTDSNSWDTSWYGNASLMPYLDTPFFMRGGSAWDGSSYGSAGMYAFYATDGTAQNGMTFRPYLEIGAGL